MARYIGKEMGRVDGVAKVTGRAKYAAEYHAPNLAHGFIVLGTIAKGRDPVDRHERGGAGARRPPRADARQRAEARPKTSTEDPAAEGTGARGDKSFRLLQSDRIRFNAQPVALVRRGDVRAGAVRVAAREGRIRRGEAVDGH